MLDQLRRLLMNNWIDIGKHNQPEPVTVNLLEDEEAINITKEAEKTDWEHVFTDQKKYEEVIKDFTDKLRDIDVPPSNQPVFTSYDPTNIQIETEITGQKIWLDDQAENRPDFITVYLFADDEKVNEQKADALNNWEYRFTNIPLCNTSGEKIIYTVKEKPIIGYTTTYDHYNLINTKVGKTEKEAAQTSETISTLAPMVVGGLVVLSGLLLRNRKKNN